MNTKPILSPQVFRVLLLASLALAIGLGIYWIGGGRGPYRWFYERLEPLVPPRHVGFYSFACVFLLMAVTWFALAYILDEATDRPHISTEISSWRGKSPAQIFRASLEAERKAQAAMLELPDSSLARRSFYRRLGWIAIALGCVGLGIAWVGYRLLGQIWQTPLAVGLVGILGGLLSVLTGRPIIFDAPKVARIGSIVTRVGLVLVVLMLVFASVMCLVTLL